MPTKYRSLLPAAIAAFGIAAHFSPLSAQQPSAGDSNTGAADESAQDELVVLSPFVVNASSDIGYLANTTLSGSRTNTQIKDIANPLDIFTKELIDDLGVTDIQDLTSIANNVETNAAGDLNSDGQEREVWNYNYMQIRGFKTGIASRNFMDLNATFEAYNSDRVEFSKGPNSILFGAGNPGGSTNYATKTPILAGNRYGLQHRFDSNGSQRVSADLNQVVVENKFGLRLNTLWENRDFYREPAYEKEEAWHLVGSWNPLRDTMITVGHESRDSDRASPRGVFARDNVSAYLAAGAPVVVGVPSNNNVLVSGSTSPQPAANLGMVTINGDNWVLDSDGRIVNMRRTARGARSAVNGRDMDIAATDLGFPLDVVVSGPNGINDTEWDITEFNITQRITDDLFADLSFGRSHTFTRQGQNVSNDLHIDPNSFGANTHVGELYVESRPFRIDRDVQIDDVRFTLSYDLDLTKAWKWLGTHQIAGMVERNERDEWWDNGRLTLVQTPAGPINPASVSNGFQNAGLAMNVRDYLNLENGPRSLRNLRSMYYSDGIDQDGYVAQFLRRESYAALRTKTELDTLLGVIQSRWWNDRLITTIGLRKDTRTLADAPFTQDAVTRLWVPVEMVSGAPSPDANNGIPNDAQKPKYAAFIDPATEISGISRNFGAVFHATDWFSLTGSYTTNFSPRTESRDLYGNFLPPSSGESIDLGFRLDLLENRLNVSFVYFETNEIDSAVNGDTINSPMNRMEDAEEILLFNGVTSTNPLAAGGNFTTADRKAQGQELLIVGNPTRNFNLRVSATRLSNELTNIAPDIKAFYAERVPFYKEQDPALSAPTVSGNLGTQIANMETAYELMLSREGVKNFPASEYNVRVTGKYSFAQSSRLDGLSLGGSFRWFSEPIIGYYRTAGDGFDISREYTADAQAYLDLFFVYQMRIGEKVRWRIQLNIENVLDTDDPLPRSAVNNIDADGYEWVETQYRPADGRMISLTNSFSF
jgi:outer membrane receptor protein involved in Fe transport